jgi:hypothetical protein
MIEKKYKLYATENGWDAKHEALMTFLGIPDGTTVRYAEKETVQNPASDDYGKFIMPVIYGGKWSCGDQFSSGVVDWQDDWNIPVG